MNNPYTPGKPVGGTGMFFGRGVELEEVMHYLGGNQSISIVGPPQIGKSSLLREVAQAGSGFERGAGRVGIFVPINCQELASKAVGEILAVICIETMAALASQGLEFEPALTFFQPARMWSDFEAVFRKLHLRGLKPVLMLDDFDWLTKNAHVEASFYNALRSIASRLGVAILTCSQRPLIELTFLGRSQEILSSPFFNIFAQLNLGLLTEPEARQLIREPPVLAGRPTYSELEDSILQLVGRHPLGLQTACYYAWEQPENTVEIERLTRQALEPHFLANWEALSGMEKELLHCPQAFRSYLSNTAEVRTVLRNLVWKCLLVPQGGAYEYPSRAWADFIATRQLTGNFVPPGSLLH